MSTQLRLLIVEDSEDDTILLVRELRKGGYNVTYERVETRESMKAALAGQWDLIIADYMLPVFSGLAALKLLQESGIDLPFIIVSGHIGEDIAVNTMKAGAHDYILKGNLKRLVPAVERELREAEVRRERRKAESALREMNENLGRLVAERTAALRENEERLERSQEIAHLGSWELDLIQDRLTWSDEVYRIFGLEPQEFGATYEAFLEAVHPDDRAMVDEAYSGSLREGRDTYEVEHRVVKRSTGEIRFVHEKCDHFRDQSGRVVRSVGMVHDITERKQAEESLRESEERMRLLVEGAQDYALFVLDELGYVASWNTGAERVKGWQSQEILGRHFSCFYPQELIDRGQPQQELEIAATTGQHHEEGQRLRKDGSRFWADVTITALRDAGGRLRGFAKLVRDITESKQAEERIFRQNRVLKGINRIFQETLSSQTDEDLARICLRVAEDLTGSKFGFINELGPDGLLHDIAISDPGWEVCKMTDTAGHRKPPGSFKIHGIYGRVFEDGKGFFTNDPSSHPDSIGLPPGHPPLTSFLGVPLIKEGLTIGMVAVGNRDGGYTAEELEALEALAPAMVEAFQRRRAEAALAQARVDAELRMTELEAVLDVAPAAIWFAHDPQCLRITGNRYADEIMKVPHGTNTSATALPGDATITWRMFRDGLEMKPELLPGQVAAATGKPVGAEMIDLVFTDGSVVALVLSAVPLFDADGRVRGSVIAGADVTMLKKAEDALRKAHGELELRVDERTAQLSEAYDALHHEMEERNKTEAQLRQAQKMEALGTLTGGIAHDFNNILAVIVGFTDIVRGHVPKKSQDAQGLDRVMEAGLRGRELIRQMLAFSRKTDQDKKPVQLSSIIRETMKLLRASIPTTVSIKVDIKSEPGVVLADLVQVQQVLMNLCTNAAYAMREKGGTLNVELSDLSVEQSNGNSHPVKPGNYARLVVRDTGEGIPEDVMDKIFDPFFTTKKLGEGTGLGLSVVHGIVRQHDGHITVESLPGKGSTFSVYLPRIAEASSSAEAAAEGAMPTGHEHILFIDDEEMLVEMGQELLEELGYRITASTDSARALALFRADPSRFDLVVTDQTMPNLTGIELAKEIIALKPDTPVILCTGFSHLVNADTARAAGIRAFAMKPLTKREIAKTIRQVLDE